MVVVFDRKIFFLSFKRKKKNFFFFLLKERKKVAFHAGSRKELELTEPRVTLFLTSGSGFGQYVSFRFNL